MNYTDKSFLDLSKKEISEVVESFGELSYRSDQLEDWIYKKHVERWRDMNNLPKKPVDKLSSSFKLHPLTEISSLGQSNDPAQKFLFQTSKKNIK